MLHRELILTKAWFGLSYLSFERDVYVASCADIYIKSKLLKNAGQIMPWYNIVLVFLVFILTL